MPPVQLKLAAQKIRRLDVAAALAVLAVLSAAYARTLAPGPTWASSGSRRVSGIGYSGLSGHCRQCAEQQGNVGIARQAMIAVLDQRDLHIA